MKMPEITPEITISRTYKDGNVLTKEESESLPGLKVKQYPVGVPLAQVTQGTRLTKNLGNFENVQIYVEVTLPCLVEEFSECYKTVQAIVEQKLGEQVNVINAHRTGKK